MLQYMAELQMQSYKCRVTKAELQMQSYKWQLTPYTVHLHRTVTVRLQYSTVTACSTVAVVHLLHVVQLLQVTARYSTVTGQLQYSYCMCYSYCMLQLLHDTVTSCVTVTAVTVQYSTSEPGS
jgi:hypothetical protein